MASPRATERGNPETRVERTWTLSPQEEQRPWRRQRISLLILLLSAVGTTTLMATTVEMAEEYEGRCKEGLKMFSPGYYGVCAIGGMLSAGATHLAITPLDVLKVNMQVNPAKYNSIFSGFSMLWKEQGVLGLWRGWAGKLYGYGAQGGCKFGLYEYYKKTYTDVFGPNVAGGQKTWIYFLSSASAQVIADIALCPFEAVKVRVQTQPNYAKGLVDGFPKFYAAEGLPGFYRGLAPLWARNLPFSILMFSTFEHTVDLLYHNVIQRKKEDCSRLQQLAITCTAGYIAGSVGTVVSNPADNVVASLYNKKAENVFQAVKNIGLVNLFTRSLPIRAAIVGPVITMQWFLYDTVKLLAGLPTSGGVSYVVETEHIS